MTTHPFLDLAGPDHVDLSAQLRAVTDATDAGAVAGEPQVDPFAVLTPIVSESVTFHVRDDATVESLHATCPSCARTVTVTVLPGPGYGTGSRPAYRHLRRHLDKVPTRGRLGRLIARTFGCGCAVI